MKARYYVYAMPPSGMGRGQWLPADGSTVEDALNKYNGSTEPGVVLAIVNRGIYEQHFECVKMEKEIESVLQEAIRVRGGDRKADYGDAVENFRNIAECASLLLGREVTPRECCTIMMAVKLMRQRFKPKRDNMVDLCGYADILQLIEEAEL